MKPRAAHAFDVVKQVGLTMQGIEATRRYDGSPVLTLAGAFVAGLATHSSAEPNSLVIRADPEERELWLQDAPDTHYLTDYYRRHPVVLVRLGRITPALLRELLSSSRRLTLPKAGRRRLKHRSDETQLLHFFQYRPWRRSVASAT
jgi:hypothetical protein